MLQSTDTGKDFLESSLTAQELRAKVDKHYCIPYKCFCTAKEITDSVERRPVGLQDHYQLYIGQEINT